MPNNVRHIVMFDFANLSTETKNHLIAGFVNLKKVPEVLDLEWGVESNAEDSSLGFTHCFILTFADYSARTKYLNSVEHRKYENEVMKYRNKVLVFDYSINQYSEK